MNFNNMTHIAGYVVGAGFVAYLLAAALSAIFVVTVPMAPGWCVDGRPGVEDYSGPCSVFLNPLEEAKYYHNRSMVERNVYLITTEFLSWGAVTGLFFYWVPKWKNRAFLQDIDGATCFMAIAGITFGVSVVAPLIFSAILPPPVEWFPQVFVNLRQAQVDAALRELW